MEDSLYEEMWRLEQEHWWFVARRKIVNSMVREHRQEPHLPSDSRLKICELGCGTGGNLASWADDHDVVGIDASECALEFARQRLGDDRALLGRLPDEIELPRNSFDVVLSTDVFEHIENDVDSAKTALSLLKPGGILVTTVPAYQWLYSPRDKHHQHFRRYARKQFGALFNLPGFKIERLSHFNTFLFPIAAAARMWSKLRGQNSPPGDLQVPAKPVNSLLGKTFSFERHLLNLTPMPFGLSLIAVIRRDSIPATSASDNVIRRRSVIETSEN